MFDLHDVSIHHGNDCLGSRSALFLLLPGLIKEKCYFTVIFLHDTCIEMG